VPETSSSRRHPREGDPRGARRPAGRRGDGPPSVLDVSGVGRPYERRRKPGIIEAAARNVRRFVYTSSAWCTASDPTLPVREDSMPARNFARQCCVEMAARYRSVGRFPAAIFVRRRSMAGRWFRPHGGYLRRGQLLWLVTASGISHGPPDLVTSSRCSPRTASREVLNERPVLVEAASLFDRLANGLGPRPRRIPVPLVYAFGAAAGAAAAVLGRSPSTSIWPASRPCVPGPARSRRRDAHRIPAEGRGPTSRDRGALPRCGVGLKRPAVTPEPPRPPDGEVELVGGTAVESVLSRGAGRDDRRRGCVRFRGPPSAASPAP
jgi:hypothetical protein